MAEKNIMRPRGARGFKKEPKEFDERVIEVTRVSRVVKGGRRIRFRALVVIGDHKGRVAMGLAKASEVTEAVRKAVNQAKKHLIEVPVINGTIPHEISVKYGSARIMLKPATSGTTIVAGGSVRVVAELAGITDLLSKIMGSSNKINNVAATLRAFSSFNPRVIEHVRKFSEKSDGRSTVNIAEPQPEEAKAAEADTKSTTEEESQKPSTKAASAAK